MKIKYLIKWVEDARAESKMLLDILKEHKDDKPLATGDMPTTPHADRLAKRTKRIYKRYMAIYDGIELRER